MGGAYALVSGGVSHISVIEKVPIVINLNLVLLFLFFNLSIIWGILGTSFPPVFSYYMRKAFPAPGRKTNLISKSAHPYTLKSLKQHLQYLPLLSVTKES